MPKKLPIFTDLKDYQNLDIMKERRLILKHVSNSHIIIAAENESQMK